MLLALMMMLMFLYCCYNFWYFYKYECKWHLDVNYLWYIDIQMPVMDGFEATKRLRLHEMECGIAADSRQRIIGISANAGDSIEQTALSSGMSCFMPVSIFYCYIIFYLTPLLLIHCSTLFSCALWLLLHTLFILLIVLCQMMRSLSVVGVSLCVYVCMWHVLYVCLYVCMYVCLSLCVYPNPH